MMPVETPNAPHPALPKYIDWASFRDQGYLQEVNRQFFHPLGLALALGRNPDGEFVDVKVWDERDDSEGIVFESFTDDEVWRGEEIEGDMKKRLEHRQLALGFGVQPLKAR